jgi:hypothetical protein
MSHPCKEAINTITPSILNQIIIYIWTIEIWIPTRIFVNEIASFLPLPTSNIQTISPYIENRVNIIRFVIKRLLSDIIMNLIV